MKLEFSRQFFERDSNLKHLAKFNNADSRMDRRTDRHDEANSRFSQFWEIAYKTVAILCPSVRNTFTLNTGIDLREVRNWAMSDSFTSIADTSYITV